MNGSFSSVALASLKPFYLARIALVALAAAGSAAAVAQAPLEYGDPYRVQSAPGHTPYTPYSREEAPPAASTPVRPAPALDASPGRMMVPVRAGGGGNAYRSLPPGVSPGSTSSQGSPFREPDTHQSTSHPVPYTPQHTQRRLQPAQQPQPQQQQQRAPQGVPPRTQPPPAPYQPSQANGMQERSLALDEFFRTQALRKPGLHLNLWFPGVQELDNYQVAQGATAAQGIALRVGDTPLFITSNAGIVPGKMNVAIGTLDQLRGLLEERELKGDTDGHLILRQVPGKADTTLLLITGRTRQGVDSAILSLGLAREKLPGIATAAIQDIILPEAPPYLRREPLRGETLYTFQQMQDTGTAMAMLPNRKLRIEFMLPGDFSPKYKGDLVMDLHYDHPALNAHGQYGGYRGAVARLNVKANDIAEETFYGTSQPILEGGVRAAASVPAKHFRQGYNFVDIEFPGVGTEGFQIFSDSTFSLPAWTVSPSLPNLQLTSRTAYPFIGQPDGSEVFVYLAGSEIETVESTWTLLAKLAQASNTVLYGAEFSIAGDIKLLGLNPEARHLIVVGKSASVPSDYRVGMPEDIFREILHKSEDQIVIRRRNLKEVLMRWRNGDPEAAPAKEKLAKKEIEENDAVWKRHERGFLGSFPPVKDRHGWIMLLTAETGANLKRRTHELVLPSFWQRITGASIFWNGTPESVRVYTETPRPRPTILSGLNEDAHLELPLGETMTVQTWLIGTGTSLLLFVVSLYLSLRKKAKLRHS